MSYAYSKDKLLPETTSAYFAEALGWESVFAYATNKKDPRPEELACVFITNESMKYHRTL